MRNFLISLLIASAISGCGTVITRVDNNHWTHDTYYKGLQADAKLLTGNVSTGYAPVTLFCWMSIVCPIVTVVSMPVDALVDTLALPFDHL